jgi:hypothetical protein
MKKVTVLALAAAAAITETTTGSAIDVSDFTGNGLLVLNSSATGGADETSDVKITHCDTSNGTFVDSGVAFEQVTNAAASLQQLYVSLDQFKKYVKVVNTLDGTTPAVTYGVEMIGEKSGN